MEGVKTAGGEQACWGQVRQLLKLLEELKVNVSNLCQLPSTVSL